MYTKGWKRAKRDRYIPCKADQGTLILRSVNMILRKNIDR